jgi:hypothetical protein
MSHTKRHLEDCIEVLSQPEHAGMLADAFDWIVEGNDPSDVDGFMRNRNLQPGNLAPYPVWLHVTALVMAEQQIADRGEKVASHGKA